MKQILGSCGVWVKHGLKVYLTLTKDEQGGWAWGKESDILFPKECDFLWKPDENDIKGYEYLTPLVFWL